MLDKSIENSESEVKEALPDYCRKYTVEDYQSWDEGFRSELYEGTLIVSEAPTPRHQEILMEIVVRLHIFLKGKPCKVYPSPFAVRLNQNEETVFEPDIVVICDKTKFVRNIYCGPPDLVVEILSPSTAHKDKKLKFQKYLKAGVPEYWIIDPYRNTLEANRLTGNELNGNEQADNKYTTTIYNKTNTAPILVKTLKGFKINLADIFAE